MAEEWGTPGRIPDADTTGDGDLDQDIDISDLSLLLAVFGVVCG